MSESRTDAPGHGISEFLRRERGRILREWEDAVRRLPAARELSGPKLRDHVPAMLDRITQLLDHLAAGTQPPRLSDAAQVHARERFDAGYDIAQLMAEYSTLRDTITRLLFEDQPESIAGGVRLIQNSIDHAVAASVDEYGRLLRGDLERERQRYHDFVHHLDHAVVWEADGESKRFTFVSQRATAVTGYSVEEWQSDAEFWQHHMPAEDFQRLMEAFSRCTESGTDAQCDHTFVRRDGREVLVHTGVHCATVDGSHRIQGITMDISPVRDALRARDEVLSIVSHDLRNPLGTIATATAVIAGTLHGELTYTRERRAVEAITRAVESMTRLIDDLLDIQSIKAGRLAMVRSPEHPREILDELLSSARPSAAERGIALECELPGELPRVLCDRGRIIQVLSNIVGNAIKVTRTGDRVTIRADAVSGGLVRFSIADTGPGIPAQELTVIFDPYRRGRSAKYKGTGLGLAIAKALVNASGGEIGAESTVGQGSTFWFTVPIETL